VRVASSSLLDCLERRQVGACLVATQPKKKKLRSTRHIEYLDGRMHGVLNVGKKITNCTVYL
jgi:hypothetical protein